MTHKFRALFLFSLTAASLVSPGCARQAAPERPVSVVTTPLPPVGVTSTVPDSVLAATVRPDAPTRYVVRKGDTLWDISAYFFRDPWLWPEIWQINRYIENPHLIYPGDVLELDWINGRPVLRLGADSGRLQPRVRVAPLDDAIDIIPAELIRPFLRGPRLIDDAALERAPYLLTTVDEHLLASENDRVYVRNLGAQSLGNWDVLRRNQPYIDPDTNEVLGIEAIFVGNAQLEQGGDPGIALLTDTVREARGGDRFLPPAEQLMNLQLTPRAPELPIQGQIISVYDGVFNIGQYQIVTVNRGLRDGLEPGHVLAVDRRGLRVADPYARNLREAVPELGVTTRVNPLEPVYGELSGETVQLPDEQSGLLLVFFSYERFSYGLIMRAERPLKVLDRVRNP